MIASVLRHPPRLFAVLILSLPLAAVAAAPTSIGAPDLKPGDTWVFDRSTQKGVGAFSDEHIDLRVEHVGVDTMVIGFKPDGSPNDFQDHALGVDWSQRRIIDGKQTTTGRPLAFPLEIGKTWTSDFVDPTHRGLQTSAEHHEIYKVTGWEDVTTPAGTFHALRIEGDDKVTAHFMAANAAVGGALATSDGATVVAKTNRSGPHDDYAEFFSTFDYVPQVKYWVKYVEEGYNSENVRVKLQTDLLISFKPGS